MSDFFGYRKRRKRADPKITLDELAARSRHAKSTISRLETEKKPEALLGTISAIDRALTAIEAERKSVA